MNWMLAHVPMRCGNCRETIRAGAAVALVTEANKPRCKSCAKAMFNAEPPTHWPVLEVRNAPTHQPFVTPSGWASTFDPKMLAAGGDR